MQNINEEIREMREQIQARLDKMENQQKVQLDGLAFMMKLSGDQYTYNAASRVFGKQLLNKRKDVFDDRLDQLLQFRNSSHGYDNINANYDDDEEEYSRKRRQKKEEERRRKDRKQPKGVNHGLTIITLILGAAVLVALIFVIGRASGLLGGKTEKDRGRNCRPAPQKGKADPEHPVHHPAGSRSVDAGGIRGTAGHKDPGLHGSPG